MKYAVVIVLLVLAMFSSKAFAQWVPPPTNFPACGKQEGDVFFEHLQPLPGTANIGAGQLSRLNLRIHKTTAVPQNYTAVVRLYYVGVPGPKAIRTLHNLVMIGPKGTIASRNLSWIIPWGAPGEYVVHVVLYTNNGHSLCQVSRPFIANRFYAHP